MTIYNYTFAGANGTVWPPSGEVSAGNLAPGNTGNYLFDGAGNLYTATGGGNRVSSPNSQAWSQTARAIEVTIGSAAGSIVLYVSNVNALLFVDLNLQTGAWAVYEYSGAFSGVRLSGTVSAAGITGKKFEARIQGLNFAALFNGVNLFTPFAHGINIATSSLQFELAPNDAKISTLKLADQFTSAQPAPSNITFSAVSDVAITATVATNAAYQQYVLERKIGAGAYAVVATQVSNVFVQTGLTAATAYDYQAKAIAADGETLYSGVFSQSTQTPLGGGGPLPPPPSGIPVLSGGPFAVIEGQVNCGLITIEDFNQSSGHTTQISGPDAALFTLQLVSGQPMQRQLAFLIAPNFSNPLDQGGNNVYQIIITATDTQNNVSPALSVTVTVENIIDRVTELDLLSSSTVSAIVGQSVQFTLRAREGTSPVPGALLIGRSIAGQIEFALGATTNSAGEAILTGLISPDAQFPSSFVVEFASTTAPIVTESCVVQIVEPANGYIYLRGRFIPRLLPVQK